MNRAIDSENSSADPARSPPAGAWPGRSPGRPPFRLISASPPPAGPGRDLTLPGPAGMLQPAAGVGT